MSKHQYLFACSIKKKTLPITDRHSFLFRRRTGSLRISAIDLLCREIYFLEIAKRRRREDFAETRANTIAKRMDSNIYYGYVNGCILHGSDIHVSCA